MHLGLLLGVGNHMQELLTIVVDEATNIFDKDSPFAEKLAVWNCMLFGYDCPHASFWCTV